MDSTTKSENKTMISKASPKKIHSALKDDPTGKPGNTPNTISEPTDHCKIGELVDNRFKILEKIGQGGYGEIYRVLDAKMNIEAALKVEEIDPKRPNMEINVYTRFQNTPHCPLLFATGIKNDYTFIAMQLLGKNLTKIRLQCHLEPPRLSLNTSFRTLIQCINAIESMHNLGFLHRDINPSNFSVGREPKNQHTVYMIDYGLSRYYLKPDGTHRPCRTKVGFRGTLKYASLNCHEEKDISRVDDIWSLFYSFYELITGTLPWKEIQTHEVVQRLKQTQTLEIMCQLLPSELAEFVKLIRNLNYADKPAYNEMVDCCNRALKRLGFKPDDPLEWLLKDCKILTHWTEPKLVEK